MDKHYRIVNSVEPAGSSVSMDEHEFMLQSDGKSALLATYHPRAWDLSAWGIVDGVGWIQDCVFQEVDVETGELLFEWRASDHIELSESLVAPSETEVAGDGRTKDTPWDYFHINSIDKNADGDYLISARHVSAIYKISSKDGRVIWRLSGVRSDFELQGFSFSSQHDARFMSENATHTVMSLFDNASNGFNQTEEFSWSMKIALDHRNNSAQLLQRYGAPDARYGGLLAKSQGNMQILPNGNIVSGWGNNCMLSEHLENGTAIFYSWIALTGTMIYRVYKANWTAEPLTLPNLVVYSKQEERTAFYVSWNGATEVTHWKFYGAHEKEGPYDPVAIVKKTGFETRYQHHNFRRWAYVEALHDRQLLRKSSVEQAFVPSPALRDACDDWMCSMSSDIEQSDVEDIKAGEEEDRMAQEAIEVEIQRIREARETAKATARKLGWGLTILLALVLLSRGGIRRTLCTAMMGWKDLLFEVQHKLSLGSRTGQFDEWNRFA